MYNKIYKQIKIYNNIVISRHIGVDPDAMASEIALRDSIRLTFPKKNVYAVGNGSVKFNYLGKLDIISEVPEKSLLIVLDTPDKRRVDIENIDSYEYLIKIDHHPFVEEFCDIEYIDPNTSSTCELIINLLYNTKLKFDKSIAEKLFLGLVSDTNRFIFKNASYKTFNIVGKLLKDFNLDITDLYQNLYMRSLNEVKLQGYISQNMELTENGVGYIKITSEILNKFNADTASAGNMINSFNYIEEVLVWLAITEDSKNDIIKVNIRSRGPIINKVAEKYNGGGHMYASGAKLNSFEQADSLIKDLDKVCEEYIESKGEEK
jgi:phosphoesterase RecJ-like protein